MKGQKEIKYDENMALPGVPVLTGEDARRFEEYDKRPLTEKEKALLKEADEFYAVMCKK